MFRGKTRQVLFRQCKQTDCRPQATAMFCVSRMFEIFPKMNESASRLDQALEEIVVRCVGIKPELLQNVVRFVIVLLVPAAKIGAIEGVVLDFARKIGFVALQPTDESRNPLAFIHLARSFNSAQIMGKLRALIFFARERFRKRRNCRQ